MLSQLNLAAIFMYLITQYWVVSIIVLRCIIYNINVRSKVHSLLLIGVIIEKASKMLETRERFLLIVLHVI